MAKQPTLTDLTSLTNSSGINAINENWDAIQEAFNNTLSLDGSTPNALNADLDLNGNNLLNLGSLDVDNLRLNGQQVTDLSTVPEWRSAWSTGVTYFVNDLVRQDGSSYICLVDHTSGTFSTDLTDLKWELFSQKGAAGAGSGDMLAANNLSDVVDVPTARANLGLGTVSTENTVPISKGGTEATDAATARTNLGVQASDATLTSLSGLSLVEGDILYATGPDALARLPKGTPWQSLVMPNDASLPEWGSTEIYGVLQSAYVLTSTTAQQKLFNWSTNGAVTLPTGVYTFEIGFLISGMSATSGNAAFGILGAGTATLAQYRIGGVTGDVALTGDVASVYGTATVNSPSSLAVSSTNTNLVASLIGTFDVTASGTLIPSISLTTAAAATVGAGSFFRCRKIGETGVATQGAWT